MASDSVGMWQENITVARPEEIGAVDFDQIVAVIKSGGAVEASGLAAGLTRAHLIAYAKVGGVVAGASAIKRPQENYALGIMSKSATKFDGTALELGYVSVGKRFRSEGLAGQLCRDLCGRYEQGLFATTSSPAMRKVLHSLEFVEAGQPWESRLHVGQHLTLWLRTPCISDNA